MLVKCNFPVLPLKKHINIFSNQWQLQAFQLAAHLGDKTKVFINDGDPILKPHSNCLFNTISGWVCPLFPEAYLPQVCVQNRNFLYGKLTFVKVIEWGKRVKVPRPAKCTKNNVIFSNRYIHIPRASKYPEKLLKLWKLCGKLPFLWWLGGSRIYMCFCLEKNICPWRHSNCWLPNSFILGGGTHSKFRNASKMQFFSFARVECRFQVRILSFSPSV